MKDNDPNDNSFNMKSACVQYTLTLAPFLQKKLDSHLQTLKVLHHPEKNRQDWILGAINKKIVREKDSEVITKEKYLGITLKKATMAKLDKRIAEISKELPGYSKKQWLLEAIEEQLEEEKELVQKKLANQRSQVKK